MARPSWLLAAVAVCAFTAAAVAQQIAQRSTEAPSALPSQRIVNEAAPVPGALVALSPSRVRLVQQTLNRRGYAAGHLTGSWTRDSAVALTNFQEAHGLEPTGRLNVSAIAALGLWDRLIGDPLGTRARTTAPAAPDTGQRSDAAPLSGTAVGTAEGTAGTPTALALAVKPYRAAPAFTVAVAEQAAVPLPRPRRRK